MPDRRKGRLFPEGATRRTPTQPNDKKQLKAQAAVARLKARVEKQNAQWQRARTLLDSADPGSVDQDLVNELVKTGKVKSRRQAVRMINDKWKTLINSNENEITTMGGEKAAEIKSRVQEVARQQIRKRFGL